MKNRIPALCLALILTLLCLPLSVSVSAEESSGNAVTGLYGEADDLARFGTDEEYAIVPCCAGSSAVDLHGTPPSNVAPLLAMQPAPACSPPTRG